MRSDVFEEDPCPGTGKYIEAHYQCLGWFIFFFGFDIFAIANIYDIRERSQGIRLSFTMLQKSLIILDLERVKKFSSSKLIVDVRILHSFKYFLKLYIQLFLSYIFFFNFTWRLKKLYYLFNFLFCNFTNDLLSILYITL